MLEPVTFYNNQSKIRDLDGSAYEKRVKEDVNLSDYTFLIKNGNQVFKNLSSIIDMTDSSSIDTNVSVNSTFSRLTNFTPLSNIKSDFYLKFVPHNGLFSLRKGFYQLVSHPKATVISKIEIWQAEVLYSEGDEEGVIYKYKANVGPLVNRFAVCKNLITGKTRVLRITDKEKALSRLISKTFYVSSAELVDTDFSSDSVKEVLWFTWE